MTDKIETPQMLAPDVEIPTGAWKGNASRADETPNAGLFGSDIIARTLRDLDIPFIALNPGASYRGLHDSLVNHLGNESPRMLLCLHEEHAVAIAHGYAKVTGKPLAVMLHSNVGLMHASMAIFNAWCDRVPMLILGATGAVDAAERRPWIEWIHTSRDQASIVRDYVKWDDQPISVAAARESILRAAWLTETAPKAPTYVVLSVEMQENPAPADLPRIDPARYRPAVRQAVAVEDIALAAALLDGATTPLILAGRVSRDPGDWDRRVALAEALGARVVTDNRIACSFPTEHPLHAGTFGIGLGDGLRPVLDAIREADVILSLDWLDLAGTFKMAFGTDEVSARVIQVTLDHALHNGWSFDYMGLPAIDLMLPGEPDPTTAALLSAVTQRGPSSRGAEPEPLLSPLRKSDDISVAQLAASLRDAVGDRDVSLLQVPLSWHPRSWHFRHPLDYLGTDGGGGIGSGPGLSVGAALALRGSGRLPIAIFGDGNFMMGCAAVWTAAHYKIPLLVIVANNQSFFNDELHQERVAIRRDRPVENKWIGQRMTDPEIDIAMIARGQGAVGLGPVKSLSKLHGVFHAAIAALDAGSTVVVDVRVLPGYST